MDDNNVTRRELLGLGAMGALLGLGSYAHAAELVPQPNLLDDPVPATPVTVAVIGLGERGREILTSLSYLEGVTVGQICDNYEGAQKRGQELAPKAAFTKDYKAVLSDAKVQGVFIATPTHLHKQIAIDALAAGKHVFCEAPLAHTADDAKAIAQAAIAAPKLIFQSGLQSRTNPQHSHVKHFVDTRVLGESVARCESAWNKKTSWRRAAASGDRERDLNWRLDKATSGGLISEIGIHSVDVASWFLRANPTSVSGFGSVSTWKDGREVPDTISAIFEYPNGIRLTYDATLGSSFGGTYEQFQGTGATVLLRGTRAWMFKEADAEALGWEVYASREKVGDETGIMLVADASKLLALGKEPGKNMDTDPKRNPTYFTCEAFLNAIRTGKPNGSGPKEGYAATVVALKANEAITGGTRVAIASEALTL
ncbi:MAG: Gfo/Idh/MocA family oxidoreductase [Armatimonas sp.]